MGKKQIFSRRESPSTNGKVVLLVLLLVVVVVGGDTTQNLNENACSAKQEVLPAAGGL